MNFGNGVSRTLSAADRGYAVVVWQVDKPPLDSEFNLAAQAAWEREANAVRAQMPSGFLLDPFQSDADYVTDENWSNWLQLGRPAAGDQTPVLWANVNGWLIPVAGSNATDLSNRINLWNPPTTDARTDFIFLEVWLSLVAPNPSTVNKPSASTIYKYGNTEFGGTNIADDLMDPNIGIETSERVQIQYRLRVVGQGAGLGSSVDLTTYPDGLGDPNVLAQGNATAPQAGLSYVNMGETLGDPGLWRAGDGDSTNALATVDGYSYAIPVCGIFRRNTSSFVARTTSGNANQNGALDRNPSSTTPTTPVEATRTFTEVTLTSAIDETATGAVQVDGLASSGLDNSDIDWDSTFLVIDGEIIYIESVSTATTPGTITIRATEGRGRNGTQAAPHDAGVSVQFYNFRPDGKFSDQILPDDILDLRRGVQAGDWDYKALLAHNLGKLFENTLKSAFKQAGPSDTQGPVVFEVDTLHANSATSTPNQTEALDGPDGIREVFSDASVLQSNVSIILNPEIGSGGSAVVISDFTSDATSWGPAAEFVPDGFQPDGGGWDNQTIIHLYIGGATGSGGARATVRGSENKIVRFISPREHWLTRDEIETDAGIGVSGNQYPFLFRLLEEGWGDPAGADEPAVQHPGPMFPLPEYNFERPFIVLGGSVNSLLASSTAEAVATGSSPAGFSLVRFSGLDFDTPGDWFPTGDVSSLSPEGVTNTLLHGQRNLFDMVTNGGRDRSGASSELYLVLEGDLTTPANNGVWRVIGAGTAGYTTVDGATAEDLVVERVGVGANVLVAGTSLTASVRSQYTHTEDGTVAGESAAVVVLTDLGGAVGGLTYPWDSLTSLPSVSQAVLDTTIQYNPSRGGTARVANKVRRVAMVGVDSAELVREAPTGIDTSFDSQAGIPEGEIYFPFSHVQTWNRLPSLGLSAPRAPAYGNSSYFGEYRREAEAFVDAGSKTLVLRPFQRTDLTLVRYRATAGATDRFFPDTYTAGASAGTSVDGGQLFPSDADYAYAFPHEWMPRLGRQDIPFHQTTGTTGPVFYGVNHLFGDSQTSSDDVFRVLGGQDSNSAVESLFFQTGTTSGRVYGEYFAMGGSAAGYQARIYEDVNVHSSDVPRGLKGIQLPPFLGIARIYGVYDLREFSGQGAWDADRVTLNTSGGRPANLLRDDQDKQTLFIVPGGGSDVTGDEDDHTYVIPNTLIDVRRSGQYVAGETFDDLEFVVECVVFGFARGFITKNNYVLARRNLPTGVDPIATSSAVAGQVSCILPLPLPYNEQAYIAYDRTVYQGDPYMTRDGATKTTSDYENRYGMIPSSSSAELGTAIQQFDSSNDYAQVPETLNARGFEVLASADFYTTLGTGKVGGRIYSGTFLDIGVVSSSTRIAASASDPLWQPQARALTEGQALSAARAVLEIEVLTDSAASVGEAIVLERGTKTNTLVSNTAFSGATPELVAQSLVGAINSSDFAASTAQVRAYWNGGRVCSLVSMIPGAEGNETHVRMVPASTRAVTGFRIHARGSLSQQALSTITGSNLIGGVDSPMNGRDGSLATTPVRMAGLIERLPLGILLQDSDFVGEDPLQNGSSSLWVNLSGGAVSATSLTPLSGDSEYGRVEGSGQIAMADGAILEYTAWTLAQPTGTKSFRLFRGGGSAWVIDPSPVGGPADWSAGGFDEGSQPVLKGALLAGRAYLVRNFPETAYTGSDTRSHGSEIQMVICTNGILGLGPLCNKGYDLKGQISPTGYGEGLAAADRYLLEGRPMSRGPRVSASTTGELAPFPGMDAAADDGC